MRRFYNNIKDFIYLIRFNNNFEKFIEKRPQWNYKRIIREENSFIFEKFADFPKGSVRRNLFASILRKLRAKTPIRHYDDSEAKKQYFYYFFDSRNNHLTMNIPENFLDTFNGKDEVFITKVRENHVYKIDPSYYISSGYYFCPLGCFRLIKKKTGQVWIQDITTDKLMYFKQEMITAFRFSYDNEIKKFKEAEAKIKAFDEEIQKLNEQSRKLSNKRYNIRQKFYHLK